MCKQISGKQKVVFSRKMKSGNCHCTKLQNEMPSSGSYVNSKSLIVTHFFQFNICVPLYSCYNLLLLKTKRVNFYSFKAVYRLPFICASYTSKCCDSNPLDFLLGLSATDLYMPVGHLSHIYDLKIWQLICTQGHA